MLILRSAGVPLSGIEVRIIVPVNGWCAPPEPKRAELRAMLEWTMQSAGFGKLATAMSGPPKETVEVATGVESRTTKVEEWSTLAVMVLLAVWRRRLPVSGTKRP